MALRWRKRVRIAPGLYLNLSHRGISATAGVRGASVTVGRRGVSQNLGVPGTGLSWNQTSKPSWWRWLFSPRPDILRIR